MDLYAYSQIENLEQFLKDNEINIPRLRGLRLMKDEILISQEDMITSIKDEKKDYLINWLKQHSDSVWSSTKDDNHHEAFIYGNKIIIDYDFSKVHGKDRKHIKLKWKQIEKRYLTNFKTFNQYVGKDVMYVHARIGGGNRRWYNNEWTKIKNHPLYLADCDDFYDNTYCDIYFKLNSKVEV